MQCMPGELQTANKGNKIDPLIITDVIDTLASVMKWVVFFSDTEAGFSVPFQRYFFSLMTLLH